jgi:hypothetical protein
MVTSEGTGNSWKAAQNRISLKCKPSMPKAFSNLSSVNRKPSSGFGSLTKRENVVENLFVEIPGK